MCDFTQVSSLERAAAQTQLKYVQLKGNIAVLSNGGSLGLATMDVVIDMGGTVSSLMDIGGTTFHEQIQYAFDICGMDTNTKVILFNCFGGMHDQSKYAALLIDAVKRNTVNGKQIVCRLNGQGRAYAHQLLKQFDEEWIGEQVLHLVDTFDEACELAIKLSHK